MRILRNAFGLLVFLIVLSAQVTAGESERLKKVIEPDGATKVDIDIDIGAGVVEIEPVDMDEVAEVDVHYTPPDVRCIIDYDTRGESGNLLLKSKQRNVSFDDDYENDWLIALSTKYETGLFLDIGACEIDMDLGGIPLAELSLDMGASSGVIEFREPNPIRMKELTMDVGASSIELNDLGNARVDFMNISCGAASCEIDFDGDFEGETELELEVGVGSADIYIPDGIEVSIEDDGGLFSSVDFHGLDLDEIDDDLWETPGYDRARDRLKIRVEVGMGSVDIYGR